MSRAQRGFHEPLTLLINVDGGPDLTPDFDVNLFLWQTVAFFRCTLLGVGAHAAKQSALNSIEHGWSPASKSLTGKQFASTMPGEDMPPVGQTKLKYSERRARRR